MGVLANSRVDRGFYKISWIGMPEHAARNKKHYLKMVFIIISVLFCKTCLVSGV